MEETKRDMQSGNVGLGKWFTLSVCSLLLMVNYMDRQVLSVVLQPMKLDLGITDMEAGMIQTVFTFGLALLSIPASALVDKWGRSKSISLMAILWSVATFLTGLGKNFIGVLIPRTFVGVGEAGFGPGGVALISASFSAGFRSRAIGIFNMALPVGIILGTVLGGYISVNYGGWRAPFFWFAVPGIILGILALFMKDYKNVQGSSATGTGIWQNIIYLLKIPTLQWSYIGLGFLQFFTVAFLAWAPAYFMRTMNIAEDKAGLIMALVVLASFIGAPLGGWLADLWYRKNIKSRILIALWSGPVAAIVYIPGVFLLGLGQYVIGLILLFLYALLAILYLAGMEAATQEVVHPRTKGMAWGLAIMIQFLIAAPAPALVGFVSDALGGGKVGLEYALLIPAAGGLLATVFFWRGSVHYPADREKVQDLVIESK